MPALLKVTEKEEETAAGNAAAPPHPKLAPVIVGNSSATKESAPAVMGVHGLTTGKSSKPHQVGTLEPSVPLLLLASRQKAALQEAVPHPGNQINHHASSLSKGSVRKGRNATFGTLLNAFSSSRVSAMLERSVSFFTRNPHHLRHLLHHKLKRSQRARLKPRAKPRLPRMGAYSPLCFLPSHKDLP